MIHSGGGPSAARACSTARANSRSVGRCVRQAQRRARDRLRLVALAATDTRRPSGRARSCDGSSPARGAERRAMQPANGASQRDDTDGASLGRTTAPSRTRAWRAGMRCPYQVRRRPTATSMRTAGSSRYRFGPSRRRISTRRTVAGVYERTRTCTTDRRATAQPLWSPTAAARRSAQPPSTACRPTTWPISSASSTSTAARTPRPAWTRSAAGWREQLPRSWRRASQVLPHDDAGRHGRGRAARAAAGDGLLVGHLDTVFDGGHCRRAAVRHSMTDARTGRASTT